MNMNLVNDAFGLFIETEPLQHMDTDHPMFKELYDKECQIFVLFNQMTEEDHIEYRKKVAEYMVDHN